MRHCLNSSQFFPRIRWIHSCEFFRVRFNKKSPFRTRHTTRSSSSQQKVAVWHRDTKSTNLVSSKLEFPSLDRTAIWEFLLLRARGCCSCFPCYILNGGNSRTPVTTATLLPMLSNVVHTLSKILGNWGTHLEAIGAGNEHNFLWLCIIAEKARARGEDVRRSKGVVVIDPNVTNKTNHRENWKAQVGCWTAINSASFGA